VWNYDEVNTTEMKEVTILPTQFLMLPALKLGFGVMNCYTSLNLANRFSTQAPVTTPATTHFIHSADHVSAQCLAESYFTQNELVISPACNFPLCLNFNQLSPRDRDRFRVEQIDNRFCLLGARE
jgi:hypothetical protein